MASRARAAASALLLMLCAGSARGVYTSQSLSTFVDTMLAEYDREVPPQARTVVALALDVRHATVDDQTATMRLLADLKMSWNDSRLTWNTSTWEGDSVLVSTERLWAPDVTLLNAGGGGGAGDAVLRARLSAGGAVAAVQRLDLSVPLALQLAAWPRDEQRAVFKFASRAHGEDEIDLVISDYKHSVVVESGAWEVVSVAGSLTSWRRGEGAAVRGAAWSVRAARRGAARAAAAAAVLAAAALLLLAAAALPYPQRPPLAACAAALAAAWLTAAMFHVPAAATTPRVLRVMCGVCVCGAACGAGAACAARVARRAAPPPAALRALLSRVSAVYALAPDPDCASGSKSGAWAAAAQLLDAAAVSVMLLALLVLVGVYLFS